MRDREEAPPAAGGSAPASQKCCAQGDVAARRLGLAPISWEGKVVNSSTHALLPRHGTVFIGPNAGSLARGDPAPGQQDESPAPPLPLVQLSRQSQ